MFTHDVDGRSLSLISRTPTTTGVSTAVDLVPVDGQRVELVVGADVLEFVVGRLGLGRVPQPDVGQGVAVGRQLRGGQGRTTPGTACSRRC